MESSGRADQERLRQLITDFASVSDVSPDEAPMLLAAALAMMRRDAMNERRLIGRRELESRIGRKDPWFWRQEKAGRFPQRIRIGPNSVAWDLGEVEAWLDSLPRGAGFGSELPTKE